MNVMPTKTTQNASRTVTFSHFSSMVIIPNSKMETSERWYSQGDWNRFRQTTVNDALRMSRLLATTPRDRISKDELQECTGIETLLDQDLFMHLRARKHAHDNAIVNGQHVYNENQLCLISKSISHPACEGARFRAQV